MYRKTFATMVGVSLFTLACASSLAAAEIKLNGAITLSSLIVTPNKAAIEQETGLTLTIIPNNAGNGLKDLVSGKADVAMIGAPIGDIVDSLNKANPGSISAAGLEVHPVAASKISFIVNPANPVKSLTEAQIKDILTGKIVSWKDVGGADQPILLASGVPGEGIRSAVESVTLGGATISDKARVMQSIVQIAQVVAQAPNAFGYGNGLSITGAVAVIPGVEVKQPFSLVTKGSPSPEVKRLIASIAKYGASMK